MMKRGQLLLTSSNKIEKEKKMVIQKIFIIGSGTMGSGLAQAAIVSGFDTILRTRDGSPENVAKNTGKITKSFAKSVEKGRLTQEAMDAALARFSMTSDLKDAADADLVIE